MESLEKVLSTAPSPQREYYQRLFSSMPKLFQEVCSTLTLPAGSILLTMEDLAHNIYFLLEGEVRAENVYRSGNIYAFALFQAPILFGEHEIFSNSKHYHSTLVCTSICRFLVMPADLFLDWMHRDVNALFMRTRAITKKLVEQAHSQRSFFFLPAHQRLLSYFSELYQQHAKEGKLLFYATREQMASQTGFCTKTISRNLARLETEGLITKHKSRICISNEQFVKIQALLHEVLD